MSLADIAVAELKSTEQFFNRSTRALSEKHSGARPAPGMMTAAQQVAHAAQTIDWFMEGAFRPEGFDTDFAAHAVALESYTSLAAARAWFQKTVAAATATLSTKSDAELMTPIAAGPIIGRRTPHGHREWHYRPHCPPPRRADRLRARHTGSCRPCRTWTRSSSVVSSLWSDLWSVPHEMEVAERTVPLLDTRGRG